MARERLIDSPLIPDERLVPGRASARMAEYAQIFPPGVNSRLPLSPERQVDPHEIIPGNFCACAPMEGLGSDGRRMAVKVFLPAKEQRIMKTPWVAEKTDAEIAIADKKEFDSFLSGSLVPFMVPTHFVIGHGLNGQPAEIQIQLWIGGKKIGEKTIREIFANPDLVYALRSFAVASIFHFIRTGEIPDSVGFMLKPDSSLKEKINAFSLLASRNLICNQEGLHLFDITRHLTGSHGIKIRHVLGCFRRMPNLVRDYWRLNKAVMTIPESELEDGFRDGLRRIKEKLESLRVQYGIDYRVVGGMAADAILGRKPALFRKNGTKRDLDVLISGAGSCLPEIEKLRKWAGFMAKQRLVFPELGINFIFSQASEAARTQRGRFFPGSWCMKGKPFRLAGEAFGIAYGQNAFVFPSWLSSRRDIEILGVNFPSFIPAFHYFLYLTRCGGYIRMKNRKTFNALKDLTVREDKTRTLDKRVRIFVSQIDRRDVIKGAINSELHYLLDF